MQLVKSLIALLFVAAGVVFGALNRESTRVDFLFGAIETRLGLLVLATLLLGAVIGGVVVTLFVVWPARRKPAAAASPRQFELPQP